MKNKEIDRRKIERARIPKQFWTCLGSEISTEWAVVHGLIAHFEREVSRSFTLFLHGGPGTGKTGAGVVILKNAMLLDGVFPTLFLPAWRYREVSRNREMFDDTQTYVDRARTVSVLLLDDLTADDLADKMFGADFFRFLITLRAQALLSSVVTTRLPSSDISDMIGSVDNFIDVDTGQSNRRLSAASARMSRLVKGD